MACEEVDVAMGHPAIGPDDSGTLPLVYRILGLLGFPDPTNARRLRGATTLGRNHDASPYITMVLLRSGVLGARLSTSDGVS